MTEAILFPHLGMKFEHVGRAISIFGFDITFYGILVALGLLIGMGVVLLEVSYTRQSAEQYLDYAVLAIAAAVLGARLYYVMFSWSVYKGHFFSMFNLRNGGLEFYGGLIAFIIVTVVYSFRKQESTGLMLDTMTNGILVFQIISIWGNFYNRNSVGEYTDSLLAMKLPIDALRTIDVTDRMRNHMDIIGNIRFVQVHPVFLYESLWCIGILILLILYRQYKKFDGELFLVYLILYSVGRFWIENLRTDALMFPGGTFHVSKAVAVLFIIGSIVLIIYNRMNEERKRFRKIRNNDEPGLKTIKKRKFR